MKSSVKEERSIKALRVHTKNDRIYTTEKREKSYHIPLRWIPVTSSY